MLMIDLVGRVFLLMVQETGVQSSVKSCQRLKKWYLMLPCTQHYKVRIKVSGAIQERSNTLPYTSVW